MKIDEMKLWITDGIDQRLEELGEETLKGIIEKIDNHEDVETILREYKIENINPYELYRILPPVISDHQCKYCKEKMIRNAGFDINICPQCGHEYARNSSRLCGCTNCNKERKYKAITREYDEWNKWIPPLISEDTFEYNDFVKIYLDYHNSIFHSVEITKTSEQIMIKMDLHLKELDVDEIKYYTDHYHRGYGMLKIQDMYEKDLIFDEKFRYIKSFRCCGGVITFGYSLSIDLAMKIQNHTIFVDDNYFYDSREKLMNLLCDSGFEYAKKQAKKRGFEIEKTAEGTRLINRFLEEECYLIFTTLVKKAVIYVSDDILIGKLDEEEASIKVFEKANWLLNYGRQQNFKQYYGYPSMNPELKDYLSTCLGLEPKKEILENRIDDILEIVRDKDINYNNTDIKSILHLENRMSEK